MKHDDVVLVSSGDGRVHVQLPANMRIGDAYPLFEKVRQLAVDAGATDLLIDARAFKAKLNMMQRLQMILAFVAKLRSYRVAGVLSAETMDPQRLGETMARNRGARVKVFTALADAEAWLDGVELATRRSDSGSAPQI